MEEKGHIMAMTKQAKENISQADQIVIEKHTDSFYRVFVRKNGAVSYVPCNYKSREGARRAVLRLNPSAPIVEEQTPTFEA